MPCHRPIAAYRPTWLTLTTNTILIRATRQPRIHLRCSLTWHGIIAQDSLRYILIDRMQRVACEVHKIPSNLLNLRLSCHTSGLVAGKEFLTQSQTRKMILWISSLEWSQTCLCKCKTQRGNKSEPPRLLSRLTRHTPNTRIQQDPHAMSQTHRRL